MKSNDNEKVNENKPTLLNLLEKIALVLNRESTRFP